jgi:hypothetical protein
MLRVTIVYAADRSTSTINRVPASCSIAKLKTLVARMNSMDSELSIRVVLRGSILRDSDLLRDFIEASDTELTLYLTGITRPPTAPPMVPIAPIATETTPVVAPTLLNNTAFWISILVIFLSLAEFLLAACAFLLVIPPQGLGMPDDDGDWRVSERAIFHVALVGLIPLELLVIFLPQVMKTNRPGLRRLGRCIKLFFVTLRPRWNVDEYKREHNIA